jgi:DNA-binding transcriptional ArsR family regulator
MRKSADIRHARSNRSPLSDEAVELIVTRLRVIGDPTRIRLLELLDAADATVQDLSERVATTRQNVSRHLAILHHAGMVSRRMDRARVYYSLVDWTGWWLVDQMAASLSDHFDGLRDIFDPGDAE